MKSIPVIIAGGIGCSIITKISSFHSTAVVSQRRSSSVFSSPVRRTKRIPSRWILVTSQGRLVTTHIFNNYLSDDGINNDEYSIQQHNDEEVSRTHLRANKQQHSKITKRSCRRRKNNNNNNNQRSITTSMNIEWLEQATDALIASLPGTLTEGRWHQVVSLFTAWSTQAKRYECAPIKMESLLKVLVEERLISKNDAITISIDLYNTLLDAWACSALFKLSIPPERASQRAREILVLLQENYERGDVQIAPNEISFGLVLHCVCRIEGAFIARRLLAWMEYLTKSRKNLAAKPSRTDYIMILDCYANGHGTNAATLAEGFIRHMNTLPLRTNDEYNGSDTIEDLMLPDTYCYNILLKAWNKQVTNCNRNGREVAEQADRILEEMKEHNSIYCRPDLITYTTVITSWAASGMKSHAVIRAEALLREIEESDEMEPNTVVLNSVMSAWVKSKNPAAVSRTEEILRQMENSDEVRPDLISYNTHLHALAIHANKQPENAQRAEILLKKLEDGYDNGLLDFGPNTFTYNLALEAVCRAAQDNNAAMKASVILRKLIKRENVEPDTYSFNKVLMALARSGTSISAKTAADLLNYMHKAYQTGVHPVAKPDADSHVAVISAYSRSGEKGYAERAESVLDFMKQQYAAGNTDLKPTRACYNALIDCWAKSGLGTLGARKAETLLQEMQDSYEAGDKSLAPTLITFNSVLNAWARSGTRCCGYKAEQYLEKMWDMYNAGDMKVKPNDFSYNTVINAISKSKNQGKAQKALRILRKMDKLYKAGDKETRPNEITYTAVLNSCAFPAANDSRTRKKALDTAMFTLKELQSSGYGQPNQVTYGTYIKACRNLLVDDDELRRVVIKQALEECIKDGQVGQMVINYIPPDLVNEVFAGYIRSGGRVSVQDLPAEWRCNVRDKDRWRSKRKSTITLAQSKRPQD